MAAITSCVFLSSLFLVFFHLYVCMLGPICTTVALANCQQRDIFRTISTKFYQNRPSFVDDVTKTFGVFFPFTVYMTAWRCAQKCIPRQCNVHYRPMTNSRPNLVRPITVSQSNNFGFSTSQNMSVTVN